MNHAVRSRTPRARNPGRARIRTTPPILALCLLAALAGPARAQRTDAPSPRNPIYIADSPVAEQSLRQLPALIEQNNLDEAVRLADQVITGLGDRLIARDPGDPDAVHIPVRRRMERFVRSRPRLLEAYRRRITPAARSWLNAGDWDRVARDARLTEPGFIAATRRAQTLIESAHFSAGMALLAELEDHPDADALAPKASALARLGARYLGTDDAWELASRWAARAGEPPVERVPAPRRPDHGLPSPRARSLIWDDDQRQGEVTLDGIVPRELAREALTPEARVELNSAAPPARFSGANWRPTAWVAPIVVGANLYTNDGFTVSCFDRFTLRPVWRVRTLDADAEPPATADARARLGRIIEDQTSLTFDAGALYAATGVPRGGEGGPGARLVRLDAMDGGIEWSADITTLDPALAEASIRGPVVVDQGVVLVTARSSSRRQRLTSIAVAGFDAATGRLLWVRQIASAGSLPFQQMGQLAHTPIVKDGVVYATDRIGLAYAVRIATGQVVWARPLPAPDLYARFARPSFAGNSPVINAYGLFVLTSDGTRLLRLDPRTGATLGSRPADPLGEALYLLGVDDHTLAAVGPGSVTLYHADAPDDTPGVRSPGLGDEDGIRGRVLSVGGKLIAPVGAGAAVLDPRDPGRVRTIALDHTGNMLALDGQIIVVDEMDAVSFLAWETASGLLDERIQQDPGAAVTLAELAFRARREDRVLPAVERAMRVLRVQPIEQRRALEDQLFGVVLDMLKMVRPSRIKPDPGPEATQPWALPLDTRLALLDDLATLARTHEQVVAHRMALGALHERRRDHSAAIRAYQDILDQPALSTAMWEGAGIAVRAGLEATRRIGAILESVGYAPYEPMDQLAITERGFIDPPVEAGAYERLAARYPWSSITPALWALAADSYAIHDQVPASVIAALEGIEAARQLRRFSIETDQPTIDRLAELAISGMIATNRARDAQTLVSALGREFPALTLRVGGRAISADQLAAAALGANQLPALGAAFIRDDEPLLVTGSPVKPATRADPGGIALYAPQLGVLRYARVGPGSIEPVWSRTSPTNQWPLIPWQDQSRTLVFWPEGSASKTSGSLEAIETTTGRTVWSIDDVRLGLARASTRVPDDLARLDSGFPLPVGEPAPIHQLLVSTDGRTVVVADRVGRAAGFDLFSGEELWRHDLPLNRVHDLDLSAGLLGVCGLMVTDRAERQRAGSAVSIAAALDARTGESIQVLDRFGAQPRWVVASAEGRLFVATTERIIALNTKGGDIDWALHNERLAETVGAWISGQRLVVLDLTNTLWSLSLADGSRSTEPLDTRGRVSPRGWIDVRPGIDRTTIASSRGLVVFDHEQRVIAADPLGLDALADIAWGRGKAVLVAPPSTEGERSRTDLHLVGLEEGRLLDTTTLTVPASVDRTPVSAVAVNGGVIIGFGEVSVFVRTTFEPR